MSRLIFLLVFLFAGITGKAQNNEAWIVAFPITDYIVPSDSISIVQVVLPEGISIAKAQLGLLKGIYRNGKADTAAIGYGKCHLIKGNYYYFPVRVADKERQPQQGDLIYTRIAKPSIFKGRIPQLAAHAVILQSVEDSVFYAATDILRAWTKANEDKLLDVIVKDINYTGKAMKEQMPSADKLVTQGPYKNQMVFEILQNAKKEAVESFLDYIIARPSLYAGNTWKASEIFATWVDGGAPGVK